VIDVKCVDYGLSLCTRKANARVLTRMEYHMGCCCCCASVQTDMSVLIPARVGSHGFGMPGRSAHEEKKKPNKNEREKEKKKKEMMAARFELALFRTTVLTMPKRSALDHSATPPCHSRLPNPLINGGRWWEESAYRAFTCLPCDFIGRGTQTNRFGPHRT
jgi:hypothetical protein